MDERLKTNSLLVDARLKEFQDNMDNLLLRMGDRVDAMERKVAKCDTAAQIMATVEKAYKEPLDGCIRDIKETKKYVDTRFLEFIKEQIWEPGLIGLQKEDKFRTLKEYTIHNVDELTK